MNKLQSKGSKNAIIAASILIIGGASIVGFAIWKGVDSSFGASLVNPITPVDHVRGNAQAKVTIVEYGDFQCPACAAYEPLVREVMKEYGDRVAFVYRHFPLRRNHKHADITSQAAESAGIQGKFWEMHDIIYDHQQDWANKDDVMPILKEYAASISLDVAKWELDTQSDVIKQKVELDLQSGIAAQVQGTPTFYVNGKKIPNPQSVEVFKAVLNDALSGK